MEKSCILNIVTSFTKQVMAIFIVGLDNGHDGYYNFVRTLTKPYIVQILIALVLLMPEFTDTCVML